MRKRCEEREQRIALLQQHVARLERLLQTQSSSAADPAAPSEGLVGASSYATLEAAHATLKEDVELTKGRLEEREQELGEMRQQLRIKVRPNDPEHFLPKASRASFEESMPELVVLRLRWCMHPRAEHHLQPPPSRESITLAA